MHKYKIKKENKLKTKTLFTVCSKGRLYVSIGEQRRRNVIAMHQLYVSTEEQRRRNVIAMHQFTL